MQEPKTILIIEDDPDDRELLILALQGTDANVQVQLAENGQEALDYLHQQLAAGAPLPGLIVLDLNMPYLDGKATFKEIRSNSSLSAIPVIIFTSSLNPNDKALFHNCGVELISKPYNFSMMQDIVHRMLDVYAKA